MACHLLSFKNPPRVLVLTDRTGLTVGLRVAVRGTAAAKTVTAHDAGKASADGCPPDIDFLTFLKHGNGHFRTRRILLRRLSIDTQFPELATRFSPCLGEMSAKGLGDAMGAASARGELKCDVAVGVILFNLGHPIGLHLHDRHRRRNTFVIKDAGHPDLSTDQS